MKQVLALLVTGIVLSQVPAQAEVIHGTITGLDPTSNTMRIRREGPSKNVYDDVSIKLKADTVAKNIGSLQDLQIGQDVAVDAQADKASGAFSAKSIELVKA